MSSNLDDLLINRTAKSLYFRVIVNGSENVSIRRPDIVYSIFSHTDWRLQIYEKSVCDKKNERKVLEFLVNLFSLTLMILSSVVGW